MSKRAKSAQAISNHFTFLKTILVRSPLLPQRSSLTQEEIEAFLKDPTFQEALYLASPNLYGKIEKILNGTNDQPLEEKKEKKLWLAVYKYLLRSMNRATPFGLFSGCALGKWSSKTKLIFSLPHLNERHTKVDMLYLCNLLQHLETVEEIQSQLLFYPNTTISFGKENLLLINYKYLAEKRIHSIIQLELDEEILDLLNTLHGGTTIDQLKQQLLGLFDGDLEEEELQAFIDNLIEEQVLVSELSPSVTGENNFDRLLKILKGIQVDKDLMDLLESIAEQIRQLDQRAHNPPQVYQAIIEDFKSIGIDLNPAKILQVDLHKKPAEPLQLNEALQAELEECTNFLYQFNQQQNNADPAIVDFVKAFYERYGDRKVSLAKVLNPETGLGFPIHSGDKMRPTLLKGVANGVQQQSGKTKQLNWSAKDRYLYKIVQRKHTETNPIIDLAQEQPFDISQKEVDLSLAHESLILMFSLLGSEEGHQILLKSVGGLSLNLIARFGFAIPGVKELIDQIAQHEQSCLGENEYFAEIVHLPDNRVGNVLSRPTTRPYEIPYLAQSSVPAERQIKIDDLMVGVTMHNHGVTLFSKSTGKIIIPRLSNAHNFRASSHPIYLFLGSLQFHNKSRFHFSWGNVQELLQCKPRVCYKRIILAPAEWTLEQSDVQHLSTANEPKITKWRNQWSIPEQVLFADGDRELLIDFTSPLSVSIFKEMVGKRKRITLKENLFNNHTGFVKDSNQAIYTNELLAFSLKNPNNENNLITKLKIQTSKLSRTFSIGSEWLYYHIYIGVEYSDPFLVDILFPFVQQRLQNKAIDQFFFIRYRDTDPHLRIRFHLSNPSVLGTVLQDFNEAIKSYLEKELIWKVTTETYEREIERYGLDTMLESEQVFFLDSLSILKILTLQAQHPDKDLLPQFAILQMLQYLDAFYSDLEAKNKFVGWCKDKFGLEFSMDQKTVRQSMNSKYRSMSPWLNQLLDGTHEDLPLYRSILAETANNNTVLFEQIKHKAEAASASFVDSLLSSYIHMHVNRLFSNHQRQQEFVLYFLLHRGLSSKIARSKKK